MWDSSNNRNQNVLLQGLVHVKMILTATLDASPSRPVLSNSDYNTAGDLDTEMLFSGIDALDEDWPSLFFDLFEDPNPDDIERNGPHTYSIVEQDIDITSDIEPQKLEVQKSEGFAPHQKCPYMTPPSSQGALQQPQGDSALTSTTLQTQRIFTGDVLQVLEAGLKHATSKLPPRKIKSVTVSSNESFKSLSSIAPALFAPDYHRSVSSRAVLIPTISHAIANVSSRASTISGLGEKVRQLARRQFREFGQDGPSNVRAAANELQKSLSVQIWYGMTSNLSSAASTRKPQLFFDVAESGDHADAHWKMDEMLDGVETDQESCGSYDKSDFEDLDDTLSGFDEQDVDGFDELESMRSSWSDGVEDLWTDHWDVEDRLSSGLKTDIIGGNSELENGEEEVL
jgi:hypothetical protein